MSVLEILKFVSLLLFLEPSILMTLKEFQGYLMLLPSSLQVKIDQRDKNLKRSKVANKDESSGKAGSLKCTIFTKAQKKFLLLS